MTQTNPDSSSQPEPPDETGTADPMPEMLKRLATALEAVISLRPEQSRNPLASKPRAVEYLQQSGWSQRSMGYGLGWFDPVITGVVDQTTATVRQARRDLDAYRKLVGIDGPAGKVPQ
jgi:hypothetical protein